MIILNALLLTIAVVGMVLVGLLFCRLRQVNRTRQLKRYRSKRGGPMRSLNSRLRCAWCDHWEKRDVGCGV
jgi:hypothetical protein